MFIYWISQFKYRNVLKKTVLFEDKEYKRLCFHKFILSSHIQSAYPNVSLEVIKYYYISHGEHSSNEGDVLYLVL